jgi:hypothetical protein
MQSKMPGWARGVSAEERGNGSGSNKPKLQRTYRQPKPKALSRTLGPRWPDGGGLLELQSALPEGA